ncbi:MAG: undecaprenyl-diphosphate phosphatase, partial [Clostridium sp.]|nr:undecaprenyl-diphosphate phosphatase [Clostridium sp.]
MEWFEAIILGLVQGLTEFLPVSSSGHLAIGRELLGVEASEDLVFEVTVHAATVLSTIVVFRKQILGLLQGLFRGIFRRTFNDETDYVLKICVSMVPVFVVGVFFKDFVTGLFGSLTGVAVALLVTSVLLIFSDFASMAYDGAKSAVRAREYRNGISYWQAFVVGLGQAVAVAPGLSRSGTTIATGLICGVKRSVMAQFSFLMVLVPILGETFLDIVGGEMASSSIGFLPLALGFVS